MPAKDKKPSWRSVKAKLMEFDHAALVGLVQHLYVSSADVLSPYKTSIKRWLSLDVLKNQETSVGKAKRAIADYKKAVEQPEGLVKLMIFSARRPLDSATMWVCKTKVTSMRWCVCLSSH